MRSVTLAASIAAAIVLASCTPSAPVAPTLTLKVTGVSPSSGTTFGGTTITVTGADFADGATVTVGGASATRVTVVDAYTIRATTGQHAIGAADVTVASGGHTSNLAGAFTYVSPGTIANAPPTVVSLTARGTRPNEPEDFADLGEEINLTAVATDRETAAQDLTYEWSANSGTITGSSGSTARWRAPSGSAVNAVVTVVVVEKYNDADPTTGLPIPKENRASRATTVSVHNSVSEVAAMARQFLLDFSDSTIRDANAILKNFTTSCAGRADEAANINANRAYYRITASSIGAATVTVAAPIDDAVIL